MTAATRRTVLAAVPAAAILPPFRDLGADDPLVVVEAALRDAEDVAQRLYEAVDVAADREAALEAAEAAAEHEDTLRERLATAPAVTLVGAAVKLRLAAAELSVAGYGGPGLDAVKSVLNYIEQQTEAGR